MSVPQLDQPEGVLEVLEAVHGRRWQPLQLPAFATVVCDEMSQQRGGIRAN